MIILTNCLSGITDEGGLKVANSLIGRIRKMQESVTVVSCGEQIEDSDLHYPSNKLLLNPGLAAYLRKCGEPVLYIPTYARMLPMALRVFILSRYTKSGIWVLLSMKSAMGRAAEKLLRMSGANVIALSQESHTFFRQFIGDRAFRLKTGVDTERFVPAGAQKKRVLREKYRIPQDKTVVLHVGHMARGRNVLKLSALDERFHGVLVVSTKTRAFADMDVRKELEAKPNVTIIDSYIEKIEELYQLADVYLFPVEEEMNCIDVPLSALEAASCGLPVVTTPYGELKSLIDCEGFYRIASFEPDALNSLLEQAAEEGGSPRSHVLPYDWGRSAAALVQMINGGKDET